ncbi:MAG: hypothetical protein EAZ57_06395 [Cytophagales bacterium]|nr:MAG: hypothetical protein EAZ67_07430 [Cytophagales bacterium]TAF60655.1 MAG: hypothetical protein EAZ57_06395 [Cytophagales bacterium]
MTIQILFNRLSVLLGIFLLGVACQDRSQTKTNQQDKPLRTWQPKYATGFQITYYDDYKVIHQKTVDKKYWLGSSADSSKSEKYIYLAKVPSKTVLLSTIIVAWFDMLEQEKCIVGFSGSNYLYNPKLKIAVQNTQIKEISSANGSGLNKELLLSLQPEAIFTFYDPSNESTQAILDILKLPVIYTSEQMEASPLAQAEWLVFIASFFNQEDKAIGLFNKIENNYLAIKKRVRTQNSKTVFCNIPYKDVWYTPSGKSFPAQLIQDAGGDYCFKDLTGRPSVPLSLENVLVKGLNADLWLVNSSLHHTKQQLRAEQEVFQKLKVYRTNQMYNPTKRINGNGNDFFETGITSPDLVLQDLVNIIEGRTDSLYFYQPITSN